MATFTRTNTVLPNLNEWNAQTNWSGAALVSGAVRITNDNGTITEFVGSSLALDGLGNATGGTVTSIRLLTSGGALLATISAFTGFDLTVAQTQVGTDVLISGLLSGADMITGGTETDVLYGYGGADTFVGNGSVRDPVTGSVVETYVGGAGNDTFTFTGSPNNTVINYALENGGGAVTVNLSAGTATDTFGDSDTITANAAVNIFLTNGSDTYTGSSGNDFVAAGGGTDTIDGGAGSDELSYGFSAVSNTYFFGYATGITVNNSSITNNSGTVIDPTGATDTFTNIEVVRGTNFVDTYNGGSFGDFFRPMGGNDLVYGGGGNDYVAYDRDTRGGGLLGVTVDLGAGTATDGFGNTDTLVSIENVRGTQFADNLTGSNVNNDFDPGEGADTITGAGGFDDLIYSSNTAATSGITVTMGAADDAGTVTSAFFGTDTFTGIRRVYGSALADTFNGGVFDDRFAPDQGVDVINGGGGYDHLEYYNGTANNAATGVVVTMSATFGSGSVLEAAGTTDTFTGIEVIDGTSRVDTFNGNSANDTFDGVQGNDFFYGGGGTDTVRFDFDAGITQGVVVDLGLGTATDGYGNTDTLSSIENIWVTNRGDLSDSILGNGSANSLRGLNGADTLNGAGGLDTADYNGDVSFGGAAGVYVDLTNGFAQDGFGFYDTLVSIENANGTDNDRVAGSLGDILIGDNSANVFNGFGGLDYIVGNGGADTIFTGAGMAGAVGDIALGGTGNDFLYGGSGATFLYGNDGSDTIYGGTGNDWVIGGDFSGTVTGTDTLFGDDGDDVVIVGNAGGNGVLYGGSGADILYGGSGSAASNDDFIGGAGIDFMWGGTGGSDRYYFAAADLVPGEFDTILGFGADDSLNFAVALSGQIYSFAGTNAGTAGVYVGATGSTWFAWMPYASLTDVQANTNFF
jgi:RTX calcium-binding nonapeptide repeat (4 copies)